MDVQRATALIPGKVNEIHLENGAVLKAKTIVLRRRALARAERAG